MAPHRPLDGLIVADFSRVVAGPHASMILGDLGADVIKVERPGAGDDTRAWGPPWVDRVEPDAATGGRDASYFLAVNRNKRSIALELTDPADLEVAHTLARRSDVLLENFRPGTLDRFGLGYDQLSAADPRLVYCSVLGFGDHGVAATLPGYDLVAQAAGGLMSITGDPDGPPTKVGVAVVDVLCSLYATIGILAALESRRDTGRGQKVSVSLMDAVLASLLNQGSAFVAAGVTPGRGGNGHPSIVPYSPFGASDRDFILATANDAQYVKVCGIVGRPDLATDPRFVDNAGRVAHRAELDAELAACFATRTAAEWMADLNAAGVPTAPINDIAEAFAMATELGLDPILTTTRADGSTVDTTRSPMRFSDAGPPPAAAPPDVGQHDAEIRAWLSSPA